MSLDDIRNRSSADWHDIGKSSLSFQALFEWIVGHLAKRAGMDHSAIDPTERFQRLGLDSMSATGMMAELGRTLGRPLSPTLAWEHPTPHALAQYLANGDVEVSVAPPAPAARRLHEEPIAIVGMACRFPKAPSLAAFWRLLCAGEDAITLVPEDRWDRDELYDPDLKIPGKMNTRWGGFIDGIDQFDPQFFGISPREAIQMDPQQRLVLELSWEALEDAGIPARGLKNSPTGIFIGAMWNDYARIPPDPATAATQHTATGQDLSIISARVSYSLGLNGPSIVVNTACSSSLVAVHLACQSLLRGESQMCLAGGVNLLISPQSTIAMSKFGAMAPDGRSKAFDARANGYVRGEGGGVVVLKRLSDALSDGNRIYCVIRGSAVNNDGFSNGLTAPNPKAQEAVLRDACISAGVGPAEIDYVEAHGTGTILGDPIEALALGAVLGVGRPADRALRIGSVKTNIGHLEAAAGIAGLIKVALSVHHETLPKSLHFERPNPHIPFDALKLRVQAELEPWEGKNGRLLAGVSSFGFGGTNCHMVIAESPKEELRLFVLSAHSGEGLRDVARKHAAALSGVDGPSSETLCASVAREAPEAFRLATMVRSLGELRRQLTAFGEGQILPGLATGRAKTQKPRVALVFGGQGSQWRGMGRALLTHEPMARAVLEQCDRAFRSYVPWSLNERLLQGTDELFDQTDFVQPALFAMQLALATMWQKRGLEPEAVIGQSMGEVAAACVAGALCLEDAVRVICLRSQLVTRPGEAAGMAVVGLSLAATEEVLFTFRGRLSVAVSSSPEMTVVAGYAGELRQLVEGLKARGVFCRLVRVDYASHSPQMDPLLPELVQGLTGIAPQTAQVPFYSTVTASLLEGRALGPEYWAQNLREPVLFEPTIRHLIREGIDVFVEVDPHPVLTEALEQCMGAKTSGGFVVASARREESERATLLEAAGKLFIAGVPIALSAEATGAILSQRAELIVLSAKSEAALSAQAARLQEHLQDHKDLSLGDIAYSLVTTRSAMEHRLALVETSREALLAQLSTAAQGQTPTGVVRRAVGGIRGKLAFLFTGQGAQLPGMGRGLYQAWPAFRKAFDRCTALFDPELSFPLRDVIWAEAGSTQAALLDQTAYTQPALFALEYALSQLWLSFGVSPDLVAGHSVGELVAACVAGVFSLEDGVRLCSARGKLMQALPPGGAMVSIATSEAEAASAVASLSHAVSIAAVNGPQQVVIAGEHAPVQDIAAAFSARGVRVKALAVSHAFHSPLMDPMLPAFRLVAESIRYHPPSIPLVKNLSGKLCADEVCTAEYWVRHVREAVRFADGAKTLHEAGARVFVEVGPQATLLSLVPACLPDGPHAVETTLLPSLRRGRGEAESVMEAVGGVWVSGGAVDLQALFPSGGQRVELPTYPWQRQRYWAQSSAIRARRPADPPSDWFYKVEWPERPQATVTAPPNRAGNWLILLDQGGVGQALAAALTSRGRTCTVFPRSVEPTALKERLAGPETWEGVVYLGGLDATVDGSALVAEVGEITHRAIAPVLTLVKQVVKCAPVPRLWIVTRGACTAGNQAGVAPIQAALWALGRVAGLEHPAAWGGLIDLDPQGSPSEIQAVVTDLLSPDNEDELAFRQGKRHAARLIAANPAPLSDRLAVSVEGSYLVTGGLGGIGVQAARWLASRGARHLILTGRRGMKTPGAVESVAALEAQGVQVHVAAIDVADFEAMRALLSVVTPPLRGVLHCAGIGPVCPLIQTEESLLRSTLWAKVAGGFVLNRLLQDQALDFFVLFSSVASVWGGVGQGAYAAANGFLDGLAHLRRAQSLPALSINWGVWSEGGMKETAAPAKLDKIGVLEMPSAAALSALERLINAGVVQQTVTRMDWARFAPVYAAHGRKNLLLSLGAEEKSQASRPAAAASASYHGKSVAEAQAWLQELVRRTVAEVLGFSTPDELSSSRGFAEMGLDSLMAVQLHDRLQRELGVPLSKTLAFDYPSVDRLVSHLRSDVLQLEARLPAARVPATLADEPIAIVGAACRFPGGVDDLQAYWRLLTSCAVVTSEVPSSRWNRLDWYDPNPAVSGKTYVARAGFLREIESFDASFFRISPREAVALDPQQRLLLELSWEALEQAGQDPRALRASQTGVFVGAGANEYAERLHALRDETAKLYAGTGNMSSLLAGRLSYFLGLQGPSLSVDTACSSSLVALHLGCQSLRRGECTTALVGGVNVLLSPESFVMLSRMRALSPDGRCKTFSADADGYGRAEGCAVVVLKRLSAAQQDGNRILGLIRGTAVNHDGASSGLTVPNGPAQQAVLRESLKQAGVSAAEVDYVECHGTGTRLGDPIEVQAALAVYGQGHSAERPLVLGSVKANLGHLEAAAGLAGVLKVLLALMHEQIPAQPQLGELNPNVPWSELPVVVAREARSWARGERVRRASVSSFGMSGTNAHLILEEAPAQPSAAAAGLRPAELVVLSAQSEAALPAQAARLHEHLQSHPEHALCDVAYSLATTRSTMEHRLAIAASSREGLQAQLDSAAQGQTSAGVVRGTAANTRDKLVFLFPGQGAQLPGMGWGLYQAWPAFQKAFDRCTALFDRELARPLRTVMWAEAGSAEAALLDRTEYTQPALFALEYAVSELWRSWGVIPNWVVGHSIGELVAACVAEVFTLEDGVRLCAARARLMQALPAGGAMVSIAASEAEVAAAVALHSQSVSVAAVNGPKQVVIAGEQAAVFEIAAAFSEGGVRTKALPVSHAFHSPLMDPMLAQFQRVAQSIRYQPPTIALMSNLKGTLWTDAFCTAEYWVRHVRDAVRFADGIRALRAAGASTFVEVGKGSTLLGMVPDDCGEGDVARIPSLRTDRPESEAILFALGSLFVRGCPVDWSGVLAKGARSVELPTYPWQRERYWVERTAQPGAMLGNLGRWPLAGAGLQMPGAVLHHVLLVGPRHQPFLGDHHVFGKVVVPGAFHISVILGITARRWPERALELRGVEFLRAIALEPDQEVELHAVLTPEGDGESYQFELATRAVTEQEPQWITHARGRVQTTDSAPGVLTRPEELAGRATQLVESTRVVDGLSAVQIAWGPLWRWLSEARIGGGAALATLVPTYPDAHQLAPMHPSLLDNGFGVGLLASQVDFTEDTPRLPFGVQRLRWWRAPIGRVRCGALVQAQARDSSTSDFVLVDEDGGVVAEVEGFVSRRAPRELFLRQETPALNEALYRLGWLKAPLGKEAAVLPPGTWLVVGPASDMATALSARIGATCVEPNGLSAALEKAGSNVNVVCLWEVGLNESPAEAAQRMAVAGLGVVGVLAGRASTRLFWVTTSSLDVQGGEPVSVGSSTLWGLGRTVIREHPELHCALIDLDCGEEAVDSLLRELSATDDENQVAWRGGSRHVARLLQAGAAPVKNSPLHPEGTVLITGGLGALGLHVARWFAQQGVQHLLLVGRKGLDTPGAAEALAELQALGGRVTIAAVDAADRAALKSALESIPQELPLRGVVHAAGILEDGVLGAQTAERFERVLRPKVAGAWNLHELTSGQQLDFFVMFSSAASLLGTPSQSNYAAANAFLDGLAMHRRAQGLPGQSISWGAWTDGGMAAALGAQQQARLARQGIKTLSTTEGLALFERALLRPEAHLGAMRLDLAAVSRAMDGPVPPLWRALLRRAANVDGSAAESFMARLSSLPPERREQELRAAVQASVAKVLSLGNANAVPVDRAFSELGLDSLMAMELRHALAQRVGKALPMTLAFDYPTVTALTQWLLKESLSAAEPTIEPYVAKAQLQADEPIAIIGIGCRYPGGVSDPESFWHLLHQGIDAICEVPKDRWDLDALYDPDPDAQGKMTTRWGGFLSDIDQFDPNFFGISPREAEKMDPQHRLLLETSWEALEHAGIGAERLWGSDTGVFVGLMYHEYGTLTGRMEGLDGYVSTGNAGSIASGRLSYLLGVKGPSLTVDTACSSSLVTVHLSCQALRQGECSVALAGGVTLMLTPATFVEFSRLRGLAPDGRSKSFAAGADGVAWSEGCGMLVLKRMSAAQRDGDTILALIRGSAVNQDGRSNGLTAPSGPAQQELIVRALSQAGVSAGEVGYVECHGTGTKLGDPIEAQALGAALKLGRPAELPVIIGSVKSNLGHTQAAAGVAGLIKAVLSLEHELIPKSLHSESLSQHIPWSELPLQVAQRAIAWPRGQSRRIAGVSSFGISGTNAHVVIEEAPRVAARPTVKERHVELIVISGRSEAALQSQVARLRDHLQSHPELTIGDVAYSLATTRTSMEYRLAIAASSREGLHAQLDSAAQGLTPPGSVRGAVGRDRGKLAFLFTGQGAQVPGMGRELHAAWPAFRAAFDECSSLFDRELEYPLRNVMWAAPGTLESALLDQTEYTQPALFTLEYALYRLWQSFGVMPDLMAGHSLGELVAACVAGVFSLQDAVRLCAARGKLMQALPAGGAMVSIEASEAEVAAALAPHSNAVSIAAVNGPAQVVISGAEGPVTAIAASFAARGVRKKALVSSHAFHSPLMEPMLKSFRKVAETVSYHPPGLLLVSNLSGTLCGDEVCSADYWVRHVRETVRFAEGVQTLNAAGARSFLEVGPKGTLLGLVPGCLPDRQTAMLPSLRGGSREAEGLLEAAGGVWAQGIPLDWLGLFPAGRRRVVLPTYAWQRQRYWVKPQEVAERAGEATGHPLLGIRVPAAGSDAVFEAVVGLGSQPWLGDHRVAGLVLVPGAAIAEWVRAAAAAKDPTRPPWIMNLVLQAPLRLPETGARRVQVVVSTAAEQDLTAVVYSQAADGPIGAAWMQHATAHIDWAAAEQPIGLDLSALRARCTAVQDVKALYARLARAGLHYGQAFQGLRSVWSGKGEALAEVALSAGLSGVSYGIHPMLLDAACHALAVSVDAEESGVLWLPFEVERFSLYRQGAESAWVHVQLHEESGETVRTATVKLADTSGALIAEMASLRLKRTQREALKSKEGRIAPDAFYQLAWQEAALGGTSVVQREGTFVVVAGARSKAAEALCARLPGCLRVEVTGLGSALKHSTSPTHVVCLWEQGEEESPEVAAERVASEGVAVVQALAGRDAIQLWWVTSEVVAINRDDPVTVGTATVWGLGRTVMQEHPELHCVLVDLDAGVESTETLLHELAGGDDESQVAWRAGKRYVARLMRAPKWDALPQSPNYQLRTQRTGTLDALYLAAAERPVPAAGEVLIEMRAAGLNFRDVLNALGMYPGEAGALGNECAGIVVELGDGVTRFAVGQEVMALVPGAFQRYVAADARLMAPIPKGLSLEQAATVPVVFLTAWYALHDLGRLQPGERLLVHAGGGGVGMAAVQIGKWLGAEIYATATASKWEVVRALGVQHLASSRTLDFVKAFREASGGQGMDLVLNALAGEFVDANLSLLKEGGRLLEMGKTDVREPKLVARTHPGVKYQAFDLLEAGPARIEQMLAAICAGFVAGKLQALPVRRYSIMEAQAAFRFMAQGRHVGKLALVPPQPSVTIQGTVLVTGGLGALGLHVAKWFAQQGARHLLLTSRRGMDTPGAARAVAELHSLGARVTVAAVDVAERPALKAVLESIPKDLPLRGVVHAAGVLGDGMLTEQTAERFARVLRPKVAGAWNLHELTAGRALDFFVLFSSAASMIGAAGQSNYAAANAFLDGLAMHRRTQGLVGQSLSWGAWSDGGMAAELGAAQQARLARQGIRALSATEGLGLFEQALLRPEAHLGAMHLDVVAAGQALGAWIPPVWRRLVRRATTYADRGVVESWAARLAKLTPEHCEQEVRSAVQEDVARVLSLESASVVPLDRPFKDLGLDSLMAVELRNALGQRVGKNLPATLAFDHPTVNALTKWLLQEFLTPAAPQSEPRAAQAAARQDEPIAIVGIGCRFPGGIGDPESFWQQLMRQADLVKEVPAERWDVDALFDPDPDAPGKVCTRRAGLLSAIDMFDPAFFEISPREAAVMDPQQRLLLEVTWEALEHAAIAADRLAGSQTGVFVGLIYSDFDRLLGEDLSRLDGYVATGSARSVASGRISYVLGLQGPSLAVDTGCSSSLVTIHLACQSLRNGECQMALAGGVTIMVTPNSFVELNRLGAMARDGRCKAFSATADGVAWSEGCGMLVLKRLSDAQAAGDRILALIQGSAVNQDGKSNGLTAPSGPAQQAVIRRALEQAGLEVGQIQYVEAHGTGTVLGDPIEMQSLGAVYARKGSRQVPLWVGSVKSNLGHTQAAAGVAGMIKAVLALQHEQIPGNLHFEKPSPHIPWDELMVEVPTKAVPWSKGGTPRRAGVSSFGISGTNAHLILQEAPAQPLAAKAGGTRRLHLLPLSAKSAPALKQLVRSYASHLTAHPELSVQDLTFTAGVRRAHHPYRLAVVGSSAEELCVRLQALQGGSFPSLRNEVAIARGRRKLAFVFSAQGGQWRRMGASLLADEPVFCQVIEKCEQALRPLVPWSLTEVLKGQGPEAQLRHEEVIQPAIFAVQVGLAALWRSWGVEPQAIIGTSMGEVAAAYVAGALSLEDACRVICVRSQLAQRVPGRMLAVALSEDQARQAIVGYEKDVTLAVVNGPKSMVLSGESAAVEEVAARLADAGVLCRWVKTQAAGHTPRMRAVRAEHMERLAGLQPTLAKIPVYSTITGSRANEEFGAAYWQRSLEEPVQFWPAVQRLAADNFTTFIEVGPHPILLSAIDESLSSTIPELVLIPTMRRECDGYEEALSALGALYAAGYTVDWSKLYPEGGNVIPLPSYPWQRERHWLDGMAASTTQPKATISYSDGAYRLAGNMIEMPDDVVHVFLPIGLHEPPYLADHALGERVIVAGAFYLAVVLAVASEYLEALQVSLRDVQFLRPLQLASSTELHVVLRPRDENEYSFTLATLEPKSTPGRRKWREHVKGQLSIGELPFVETPNLAALREKFKEPIPVERVFAKLAELQMHWGPQWRAMTELYAGKDAALAKLASPDGAARREGPLHPVLLDNAFGTAVGMLINSQEASGDAAYAPWLLEELRWYNRQLDSAWCYCLPRSDLTIGDETMGHDLLIFAADGQVAAVIAGFVTKRVQPDEIFGDDGSADDLLYELAWRPAVNAAWLAPSQPAERWLVFLPPTPPARELVKQLAGAENAVVVAEVGESYARVATDHYRLNPADPAGYRTLLHDAFPEGIISCRGIIHLFSLDATPTDELSPSRLEHDQVLGAYSALFLVQALAQLESQRLPRLWLVTAGTQDIPGDVGPMNISQAPLWGFGQAVAREYEALLCTRIDLPARPSTQDIQALVGELLRQDQEPQIVLRGSQRYVARLTHAVKHTREPIVQPVLRPEYSYLITGGLGGVGLATAELLAKNKAKHLVLVGRRAPDVSAQQAIERLKRSGTDVAVEQVDISNYSAVAELIARFGQSWPALGGIIHSAATLIDGTIPNQTIETFRQTLAAKMFGAWNLHELTQDRKLDFFVCYSSIVGLFLGAGQSSYAAANLFVDALAHHRNRSGVSGMSINWGLFSQIGEAERRKAAERYAGRGHESLSPAEGMQVLWKLLNHPRVQLAACRFNARKFLQFYQSRTHELYLSELLSEVGTRAADRTAQHNDWRGRVLAAGPTERRVLLEGYIKELLVRILRIAMPQIYSGAPLLSLGMDSLMAVELKNRINNVFLVAVPVPFILKGASASSITDYVLTELAASETPVEVEEWSV